MKSCKSCDFFGKAQPEYIYGYCHRYPPVSGFSFSVRPGRYGEGGEATITRNPGTAEYPNISQDEWCGEYNFTRKIVVKCGPPPAKAALHEAGK